ncbi:MAG: hypothetical protein ABSA43_00965 [Candidatus Microgenomates bacterium]
MISVRKKLLYEEAKKLRQSGKSYSEIKKETGVSRSTLSSWFAKAEWSKSIGAKLTEKYKIINASRLVKINKIKGTKTELKHDDYRLGARNEYQGLKQNRLFNAGISIYWGEGDKSGQGRVAVVNSDPGMMQVMVNFYRKILNVPEKKLRAALFLYKDINEAEALKFWSEKLRITKERFIKTQFLPSKSTLTKSKVTYGMCNIYFCSTEMSIKIDEWIRLMIDDMRV